jgi:hypothetical protein
MKRSACISTLIAKWSSRDVAGPVKQRVEAGTSLQVMGKGWAVAVEIGQLVNREVIRPVEAVFNREAARPENLDH